MTECLKSQVCTQGQQAMVEQCKCKHGYREPYPKSMLQLLVLRYVAIPSTNLVEPVVPLPLSVSTATFPGTPTVHLIGDYHFQVVPVTPLLSDFS